MRKHTSHTNITASFPDPIEERLIVVTDPMLATGGSAVDAIDQIKKHGGKRLNLCVS